MAKGLEKLVSAASTIQTRNQMGLYNLAFFIKTLLLLLF